MAMDNRLLVPRYKYDPDAARYLAAVEAADGQALETPVRVAINTFFRAVKDAGIYSDLKSAAILCGARTITGALVPLAGTAPTANGFVAGDYSRTAGLAGDGTSYLNSNRANDADGQNDAHISAWCSAARSSTAATEVLIGANGGETRLLYGRVGGGWTLRCFGADYNSGAEDIGFVGISRDGAANEDAIANGVSAFPDSTSQAPIAGDIHVFGRPGGTPLRTDATIAFYSIGTSLGSDPATGLAALDTAVDNLISDIGAAL